MKKRFRMLALLLSACMMLNLAPMSVLAAEVDAPVEVTSEATEQDNTENSSEESPVVTETSEEEIKEEPSEEEAPSEDQKDVVDSEDNKEVKEDAQADSEITVDVDSLEMEEALGLEQELLQAEQKESRYFTVESDGSLAFKEGVKAADLPKEIKLEDITDAGNVTKIPSKIFYNSDIEVITIPKSVSQFGEGAFEGCVNLTTVKFEDDTTSATEFPKDLFKGCRKLRISANGAAFKIPAGVTKIGKSSFENCESLITIDFSKASSLTTIADYAFASCTKLDELNNLSTGTVLETIGQYAFEGTRINFEVKFPKTLKKIDSYAFWNCSKLGRVDLDNLSNITLAAGCFANSGITAISLPDGYNTIEPNVFANCLNLRDITIGSDTVGKNVTKIRANAFKDCKNLQAITLKASVKEVENDAFKGCSSLTSVKIYNRDGDERLSDIKLYADSFPANTGLVVSSYGGTAEEWAGSHTEDGVKYESMFTGMQVVVNGNRNGNSVTASPSLNVKVGDKLTLTPKTAAGYTLISLTRGEDKRFVDSNKQLVVSSADINSEGKIQVDTAFTNIVNLNDTFKIAIDNASVCRDDDDLFSVRYETANQNSQIKIRAYLSDYNKVVYSNPWLWTFTSSDPKTVAVDANGKLRLLKKTDETKPVKITAKLKSKQSIALTLNVYVGKQTEFDHIEDVKFAKTYNFVSGIDEESKMKYIQTSKAWLEAATSQKKTRNVDVELTALDVEGTEIQSSYKWVSDNTSIVKVAAVTTNSNENTLQVCGVGETTVKATSTIKPTESYSFIVRVVDLTPYVQESALTVNARATKVSSTDVVEEGLDFTLIQSYGGTIANNRMEIMRKDGTKYTSLSNDFAIEKDGALSGNQQKVILGIKKESPYYTKNASYTNLYIKLMVNGSYYYVKLPKVTVVNTIPKPSVKLAGKINSFYKRDAAEQTVVTATINSPAGFTIAAIPTLESDAKTDANKYFANNFKVEPVTPGDYSKLNISLKKEALEPDAVTKKIINTGFLSIQYKGDYDPIKLKITVPYGRTVPSLAFDKTTVTTHVNAECQSFEVGVINKATKKNVELDDTYTIDTYTTSSSDYFFDTTNPVPSNKKRGGDDFLHPAKDSENNKVVIALGKQAPKSNVKAYVLIQNENWNLKEDEGIPVPVTVAVTKANPTVAVGNKGVIDINLNAKTNSNNVTFDVKSDYVDKNTIKFGEFVTTATKQAVKDEAAKIALKYEDGKIVATIDKGNAPATGTYAYTAEYKVNYVGGETEYNNKVTIKVAVSMKYPKLVLKTGTFTLNNTLVGVLDNDKKPVEIATTTYSITNIAPDAWNTLNKDYAISDITNKRNVIDYASLADAPVAISFKDGVMSVYLKEKLTGNHTFKLSNLTVDGLPLPDVNVVVKPNNAEPTITLSGKGSINVLEPTTAVTYTLRIKNFGGTIDPNKLVIESQDTSASANASWITSGFAFKLDRDSINGKTIKLIANPAMKGQIESRKYTMRVYYKFGNRELVTVKSPGIKISTKPIQTMPKLTQSSTTATVYSGTRSYVATVQVTPKTGSNATITGVAWNKTTNATLQEAFAKPKYDAKTNTLSIQLKNPALLKKNTTYTLNYVVECDGQLTGTTGTAFSVKVTVK